MQTQTHDWFEYSGRRYYVYRDEGSYVHAVDFDGGTDVFGSTNVGIKWLPDCDSWEWDPPSQARPFANAEEYRPHRDRWIKRVDGEGCWKPAGYSNEGIHVDEKRVTSYEALFEKFTFEDGSKCGVDPDIPF